MRRAAAAGEALESPSPARGGGSAQPTGREGLGDGSAEGFEGVGGSLAVSSPPGRCAACAVRSYTTDSAPPQGEGEDADVAWADASHPGQRAPAGDWRTWVFLGGRGAGKTRAGAEWVWARAAELARRVGAKGRIALVAPTLHDARTVMVEGPSGAF